ncbi:NACHT domain-containing NTPase [Microcoleus sp. CAWBG58]|uniref:NACHT domain-containing protein n=1 Tax=Microcoleus sp. CAWBG58 TaxID=2841651 RepID=UPI0025DC2505|nr:NACHT domain-containing protein [Microcoleus sp. CAWBG58]
MEWLVLWGVQNFAGFIFSEVVGKLAQSALEDYVKDFFKASIKDLVGLAKEKPLTVAFGKGITEFLYIAQGELEDAEDDGAEIDNVPILQYQDSLEKFLQDKSVLATLGQPFNKALGTTSATDGDFFDIGLLAQKWNDLNLQHLPDEFNWQKVGKRYTKKVTAIVRESDELRKLLDSQNLAGIRTSLAQSLPISPNFDFIRYQEGLKNAYGKLKLDSLDTSGCNYSLQLWNIFVPQNVEENTNSVQPITILDLINGDEQNYKYTVILGRPGSGKSTLTQYKALEWARVPVISLPLQELPLLIELRNYIENRDKSQNFLHYLHQGSGVLGGTLNQHELDEWLKHSSSIVMFDGLDEVLDDRTRENVVIDIINFTTNYPKVRVLVTSRIVGYEQQRHRFQSADFHEFMLQDLNIDQITSFVTQWHKLAFEDRPDEGHRKCDRLLGSIDRYSAFQELAGNPLLLTMMTILNRFEELPRDRATLYERASELLLQRWDGSKNLQNSSPLPALVKDYLDYKRKQEMLRFVAHKMQDIANNSKPNLVIAQKVLDERLTEYLESEKISESKLVATALRKDLTARSFILCFLGGDTYGFVHRTFLEYFCAWHFVVGFQEKQDISLEKLKETVFGIRWHDSSWHEVLSLIVSKLNVRFSQEIIEYLLEQDGTLNNFSNLFLAAKCCEDMRDFRQIPETQNRLVEKLQSVVDSQAGVSDETRNDARKIIEKYHEAEPLDSHS